MFHKILAGFLSDRNLTQAWLVKKTGYSKATVSKLISGEQEPKYSHIEVCAEALGVQPGDFFLSRARKPLPIPVVGPYSILHSLYEDSSGHYFLFEVYAVEDYDIPNTLQAEDSTYIRIVSLVKGHISYNGTKHVAGDTFYTMKDEKLDSVVKVKAGAKYIVCLITGKKHTFEEIIGIRTKRMEASSGSK